jgi:hypothetical protein
MNPSNADTKLATGWTARLAPADRRYLCGALRHFDKRPDLARRVEAGLLDEADLFYLADVCRRRLRIPVRFTYQTWQGEGVS